VNSVETLLVRTREQAEQASSTVRRAEGVFIAGGDQSDYVRAWNGTALEDALEEVAQRGPIGGTSAGLAVLGEVVYTANNGSVYPREALRDPFNRYMTFERHFLDLPGMDGVVTETHFRQRNRMGRFLAFLARMRHGRWVQHPRGIAVDEGTALLVDDGLRARVAGDGAVYLAEPTKAPRRCERGKPLVMRGIRVWRAQTGDEFSLTSWSEAGMESWRIGASGGELHSSAGSPYGP
jgi:cyanophycinase